MIKDIVYEPLTELDREIFDATVPADHYLRRVKAAVNFERFRELLVSRYSLPMGRPPIEPLLMLKLEFLQFRRVGGGAPRRWPPSAAQTGRA
jgi:hypothetical protein